MLAKGICKVLVADDWRDSVHVGAPTGALVLGWGRLAHFWPTRWGERIPHHTRQWAHEAEVARLSSLTDTMHAGRSCRRLTRTAMPDRHHCVTETFDRLKTVTYFRRANSM